MGMTSFDVLSELLERYESSGGSVRRVEATTGGTDDAVRATVEVPLSLAASADPSGVGLAPEAAALTEGGRLRVDFTKPGFPEPLVRSSRGVSTSDRSVCVADGEVRLTVDLVIDPTAEVAGDAAADETPPGGDAPTDRDGPTTATDASDGSDPGSDLSDALAAVREESVPAYEDTEYLRLLYDSCDTFAEMSREIEMDVSSETVRRYMIERGIHDPTSYETAPEDPPTGADDAADDAEARPDDASLDREGSTATVPGEQLLTDGVGLPADLTVDDIAEAVADSMTMYEVNQRLGLEQRQTRELLRQLNLVDLVFGRLDDNPERSVGYEEVTTRIRQSAPVGP